MFSWYWVADFCKDNNIKFILGHALYMKAIHGGKAKNDKINSYKIVSLIRQRRHISPGFCLSKRYESYTGSFKKKNAFNEKTS